MKKNYRKTKILATIGPSSEKINKIEKLVLSGVDAFRINCSHTNKNQLKNYVKNIREIEKKYRNGELTEKEFKSQIDELSPYL